MKHYSKVNINISSDNVAKRLRRYVVGYVMITHFIGNLLMAGRATETILKIVTETS